MIEYPLKITTYSTEILNVTKYRVASSYTADTNTFHGRRVVFSGVGVSVHQWSIIQEVRRKVSVYALEGRKPLREIRACRPELERLLWKNVAIFYRNNPKHTKILIWEQRTRRFNYT